MKLGDERIQLQVSDPVSVEQLLRVRLSSILIGIQRVLVRRQRVVWVVILHVAVVQGSVGVQSHLLVLVEPFCDGGELFARASLFHFIGIVTSLSFHVLNSITFTSIFSFRLFVFLDLILNVNAHNMLLFRKGPLATAIKDDAADVLQQQDLSLSLLPPSVGVLYLPVQRVQLALQQLLLAGVLALDSQLLRVQFRVLSHGLLPLALRAENFQLRVLHRL